VYAFFETFGVIGCPHQRWPRTKYEKTPPQTLRLLSVDDVLFGLDLGGSAAQSVFDGELSVLLTVIQGSFY